MNAEAPKTQAVQPVFDPENPGASLDKLQREIPINAKWLKGVFVGETPSKRHGVGFDFDGIRDLQVGDDRRYVDARATARQTDPNSPPQYRVHYADIQPALWIVTDMFQSRNNVTNPRDNPGEFPEQLLAVSAITSLMRIAYTHRMPWGVIASDDNGIALRHKHAKNDRKHMLKTAERFADLITDPNPQTKSERYHLPELLRYAGRRLTGSVVVVVSDFRDQAAPETGESPEWMLPLAKLAKQGNQLITIETTYPWDFTLPITDDRIKVNGKVLYVGNDRKGRANRQRYETDSKRQAQVIESTLFGLERKGLRHISLDTREGRWLDSLRDQLTTKRKSKDISTLSNNVALSTKVTQ